MTEDLVRCAVLHHSRSSDHVKKCLANRQPVSGVLWLPGVFYEGCRVHTPWRCLTYPPTCMLMLRGSTSVVALSTVPPQWLLVCERRPGPGHGMRAYLRWFVPYLSTLKERLRLLDRSSRPILCCFLVHADQGCVDAIQPASHSLALISAVQRGFETQMIMSQSRRLQSLVITSWLCTLQLVWCTECDSASSIAVAK